MFRQYIRISALLLTMTSLVEMKPFGYVSGPNNGLKSDNLGVPSMLRQSEANIVAFSAAMSKTLWSVKLGYRPVFDLVLLNEGGAYHNGTGIFHAPVNGLYEFHMQTTAILKRNCLFFLMKEGNVEAFTYAHGTPNSEMTSSSTFIYLQKNHAVWVEMQGTAEGIQSYNGYKKYHTTFSGSLITAA